MSDLGDFLKAHLGSVEPWNCSTAQADWCMARGHPDFAAKWRGTTDPADCLAVAQAHALADLWAEGIGDALPEVEDQLQAGDIAVVKFGQHEAGAIWTGDKWAIRIPRGWHFAALDQVDAVRVWRP